MNRQQRQWYKDIGHPQPIGLGDLVAGIFERVGIASLVKRRAERTGKACGCEKRRQVLNKIKLPS